MKSISIVYFSGSGHTAKLAESVQQGAASVEGIKTNLISIDENDIIKGRYSNNEVFSLLTASDSIIFGSPTYMGNIAAQFKAFADASVDIWAKQEWRNKLAAGFTVSGTPSGDKLASLQFLNTLAMQHGMIWISLGESPMQANGVNRLGSWGGAMAQANQEPVEIAPNEEDRLTCKLLGERVAYMTLRFKE